VADSAQTVRLLPDSLINKIAAGEVIERPASVVKELVENSLDAGAGRIEVRIAGAGRSLIEVVDDGQGMSRLDARACLQRHATSKLRTDDDLFAIRSLGFRGEAIPSIAEISRFEIETGLEGDLAGTRVLVDGGEVVAVEDCHNPGGTRIQVRRLFFNTPVRLKFLKSQRTEVGHVQETITRLAMANPDVAFKLVVGDATSLDLLARDTLRARVEDLLGRSVSRSLHDVLAKEGDLHLEGLISDATLTRGNTAGLHFFVNGRYVKDRALVGAVMAVAGQSLPRGRYPLCVLFLDLPPESVDVNVHPAKIEVRFEDGRTIWSFVSRVLGETPLGSGEGPDLRDPLGPLFAASAPKPVQPGRRDRLPSWADRKTASPVVWGRSEGAPPSSGSPSGGGSLDGPSAEPAPAPPLGNAPLVAADRAPAAEPGLLRLGDRLVLTDGGLVLLDVPLARRCLLAHRLRTADTGMPARPLLVPALLERSAKEVARLMGAAPELSKLGVHLSDFGGGTLAVHALPDAADPERAEAVVEALLAKLGEASLPDALAEAAQPTTPGVADEAAARALLRRLEDLPPEARAVGRQRCVVRLDDDALQRLLRG
jgi:DNA mismatch repair protein MutL